MPSAILNWLRGEGEARIWPLAGMLVGVCGCTSVLNVCPPREINVFRLRLGVGDACLCVAHTCACLHVALRLSVWQL